MSLDLGVSIMETPDNYEVGGYRCRNKSANKCNKLKKH